MGYRSQVALKTTTEGYLLIKKLDKEIEKEEDRALAFLHVMKTDSGFYKVYHDDIKWYDTYENVKNLNKALAILEEENIPYSFNRIGEDCTDIEHKEFYSDDMPDEIETFLPDTSIYDENEGDYMPVMEDDDGYELMPEDKIRDVMYELFDKGLSAIDIKVELGKKLASKEIMGAEYTEALDRWDDLLIDWEESKKK